MNAQHTYRRGTALPSLAALLVVIGFGPSRVPAAELTCATKAVEFKDAFAGRQLLVSDGGRDVTRDVQYASANPHVARVDSSGYVTPTGDGATSVHITRGTERLDVTVKVAGIASGRAVDFKTELVPLLSRLGCNAGGCHGKASGQNGFKLSLFGFDATFDYEAIAKEARGRRVFPAAPDAEPAPAEGDRAGAARRRQAAAARTATSISCSASGSRPACRPRLPTRRTSSKLRIMPGDRVLRARAGAATRRPGRVQRRPVRDVTRQAEYSSNSTWSPAVDPDGLVQAGKQSGEAAIMARYMGYVAVFRAMVPHGEPLAAIPEFKPTNYVDELAARQVEEARPAALAAALTTPRSCAA